MTQFNQPFTTQEEFNKALEEKGYKVGRIAKITYQSPMDNEVVKITIGCYKMGYNYGNDKRVKSRATMGVETKARKSSDTTIDNYLVVNKNGELKLRLFTTINNHLKAKTTYYYKGNIVEKQWLIDNGLIKEQPPREKPTMITIMLKNLLAIG